MHHNIHILFLRKGPNVKSLYQFTSTFPQICKMARSSKLFRFAFVNVLYHCQHSGPPEEFKFDGSVEIILTCKEATDKLYLHINYLDIDNSTIVFRAADENHTPIGKIYSTKR